MVSLSSLTLGSFLHPKRLTTKGTGRFVTSPEDNRGLVSVSTVFSILPQVQLLRLAPLLLLLPQSNFSMIKTAHLGKEPHCFASGFNDHVFTKPLRLSHHHPHPASGLLPWLKKLHYMLDVVTFPKHVENLRVPANICERSTPLSFASSLNMITSFPSACTSGERI
jgi:hypothetical protein